MTEIGAPGDVKAPQDAHFWKRSKTLEIWICTANHKCESVRDKRGRPLKSEGQVMKTG